MARGKRGAGVAVQYFTGGPYDGQRDLNDPTARAVSLAHGMINVYARDPQRKAAIVGRPGYMTTQGGAQLGSGGARRVQAIGQFQRLGGAFYTFAVVGGLFYTYDWGADTWTNVALGGGAALSSSAEQIGWVVGGNLLVLSDGVNRPCTWDGSTWAVLSNCPVLLYQPWMHLGRLWGIKATDGGATITWSEPNQLNTGYTATIGLITYRNEWTLGQTSQDGIVAGRGLNDRMLLWRKQSVTAVYGAVDENFATGATRDTVSETVGCGAPWAVDIVDGTPYWVASDGWSYALPPGAAEPVGIGDEIYETMASINLTALTSCRLVHDRATDLVLFAMPMNGLTVPETVLPVHTTNLQPQGQWLGYGVIAAMAAVRAPDGNTVRLHGGTDGRVYVHGHPFGNLWNDVSAAGTAAIYHMVRTEPLGWQATTEQFWDRLDVAYRARSPLSNLTVQAYGPYGYGPIATVESATGAAQWDVAKFDEAQWAIEGLDQHAAFGFEVHGRWQQFEVRHQTLGEQFGFLTCTAWARATAAYPELP